MKIRFSIRDLIFIIIIAALAFGWWLDHSNLTRDSTSLLSVYSLADANPAAVLATLQQLYGGNSDVSLSISSDGKIISRAPSKQQREIEALVMRLDVPGPPTPQNMTPP
jgi:hypothetical protein